MSSNIESDLNNILASEYDFELVEDQLNIAVIGKTKAGKSTFINAFRGLANTDKDSATTGAGVNPTQIKPGNRKFVFNRYNGYQINLYDIEGFSDNKDTKIEPQLKKIKSEFNIKEFDAIIFITDGGLEKKELDLAKYYESKRIMLFFVYNKIDELGQNLLNNNDKFDRKKSLALLFEENKELLNQGIKKNTRDLFENLINYNVFNSQISEVKNFICKDLKSKEYTSKIVKNSIYLITSNRDDFEDEFLSPDGKRLRTEIKEHLLKIKMTNLDLYDKHCKRTIFLKKKIILRDMFKTFDSIKRLAIGATLSIIPFLDIPYTNRTKSAFRNKFFDLFGIKKIMDTIDVANESPIELSDVQKNKLKKLIDQIKKDRVIKQIDELIQNSDGINSTNFMERVTNLINAIFPAIGIAVAGLSDDIASKIATVVIGFTQALSKSLLIALALVTLPIGMTIYVFLTMRAIEKILMRYEEYALIIAEILHPDSNFQINLENMEEEEAA